MYGLAERYEGSLSISSGYCQSDGWTLGQPPSLTLELKQTESGGLELWFEGSDSPLYAQLCRLADEQPVGLCLYGRQLKTYQVSSPQDERSLSCLLWTEVTEQQVEADCCERVSQRSLNTLLVTKRGGLEGELTQQLSLSAASGDSDDEALCGGQLSCQYQLALQMEPLP